LFLQLIEQKTKKTMLKVVFMMVIMSLFSTCRVLASSTICATRRGSVAFGIAKKNRCVSNKGTVEGQRLALFVRGGAFNNPINNQNSASTTTKLFSSTSTSVNSFFDLSAPDLQGNVVDFNNFRNKVTIITNVASRCGYTASHYKGLVELWSKVKDSNKVNILGFPCNQFMRQEPGSAEDIAQFAKSKGVEFTMMSKIDVNGDNADPVYKYLKEQSGTDIIRWNFATYFIISPDGTIKSYDGVEPMELLNIIESMM
jgi:glutathione peroxidase